MVAANTLLKIQLVLLFIHQTFLYLGDFSVLPFEAFSPYLQEDDLPHYGNSRTLRRQFISPRTCPNSAQCQKIYFPTTHLTQVKLVR